MTNISVAEMLALYDFYDKKGDFTRAKLIETFLNQLGDGLQVNPAKKPAPMIWGD